MRNDCSECSRVCSHTSTILVSVLVAILFTPLVGVQIANAATLESAMIKLISDGTGHGTKDASKINSKNGYPVADDGPND